MTPNTQHQLDVIKQFTHEAIEELERTASSKEVAIELLEDVLEAVRRIEDSDEHDPERPEG